MIHHIRSLAILRSLLLRCVELIAAVGVTTQFASAQIPTAGALPGAGRVDAVSPAPAASPISRTSLPPGQVWQCLIGGQRIFSDSPCGEHASIRQLKELNVMDSPRPQSHAYPYRPMNVPSIEPAPQPAAAAADDSDYAGYWGPDVLWVRGYPRRNHFPRQDSHVHAQSRLQSHSHPHRN
jgi:hypothetical protein